jgi:hypothetical protein
LHNRAKALHACRVVSGDAMPGTGEQAQGLFLADLLFLTVAPACFHSFDQDYH